MLMTACTWQTLPVVQYGESFEFAACPACGRWEIRDAAGEVVHSGVMEEIKPISAEHEGDAPEGKLKAFLLCRPEEMEALWLKDTRVKMEYALMMAYVLEGNVQAWESEAGVMVEAWCDKNLQALKLNYDGAFEELSLSRRDGFLTLWTQGETLCVLSEKAE